MGVINNYFLLVFIALIWSCDEKNSDSPAPSPVVGNGKPATYGFAQEPVWADEFNYVGLPDSTKWGYDVGGGGWGNNELEYYTLKRKENARVETGNLIIQAHKESFGGREYTSARLVSKGRGDWTYGKIEVRAKLPKGRGSWPAIWMLASQSSYGDAYWPDNGEIDVMEHVGYDPGIVHCSIHTENYNHTKGTQRSAKRPVNNFDTEFHLYSVEWTPLGIKGYIDNINYFTFNSDGDWRNWPFDKPFHLLLNIAVGGNWGGVQGVDDAIFPIQMEVDYVRVYPMIRQ